MRMKAHRRAGAMIVAAALLAAVAGCDQLFPQSEGPAAGGDEEVIEPADTATALDPAALEGELALIGPGGDWRGRVSPIDGVIVDEADAQVRLIGDYAAPAMLEDGVQIGSAALQVTVTPGPCEAGAEGVTYPFTARVDRGDGPPLEGCLYRPWEARVPALYPAIIACLAEVGGDASVTYADYADGDRAFVRIMRSDMALADCTAGRDGSLPSVSTAAPGTYPGENDVWFVAGRGENPGGECYTAPQVISPDGTPLGWLVDPVGC
jgi:hypothetical protein